MSKSKPGKTKEIQDLCLGFMGKRYQSFWGKEPVLWQPFCDMKGADSMKSVVGQQSREMGTSH
jgi:hypothetical protein